MRIRADENTAPLPRLNDRAKMQMDTVTKLNWSALVCLIDNDPLADENVFPSPKVRMKDLCIRGDKTAPV
jgi:hypothetical protein